MPSTWQNSLTQSVVMVFKTDIKAFVNFFQTIIAESMVLRTVTGGSWVHLCILFVKMDLVNYVSQMCTSALNLLMWSLFH